MKNHSIAYFGFLPCEGNSRSEMLSKINSAIARNSALQSFGFARYAIHPEPNSTKGVKIMTSIARRKTGPLTSTNRDLPKERKQWFRILDKLTNPLHMRLRCAYAVDEGA